MVPLPGRRCHSSSVTKGIMGCSRRRPMSRDRYRHACVTQREACEDALDSRKTGCGEGGRGGVRERGQRECLCVCCVCALCAYFTYICLCVCIYGKYLDELDVDVAQVVQPEPVRDLTTSTHTEAHHRDTGSISSEIHLPHTWRIRPSH